MNAKPIVSVIITSYNYGKYLPEALNSVIIQDYSPIEIIIVDDGSTDANTLQVLKDIKSGFPDIKVLYKANGGPSSARNYGIRFSKGEYILPLDADDTLEPGYISACINAIGSQKNISPVYCWANFFGDSISKNKFKPWDFKQLLKANYILSCSLYTREAWLACNGYDENLFGLEDYELWLHMALKGYKGLQLEAYYVNIRLHQQEAGVTSSSLKKDPEDYKTQYIKFKHKLGFKPMLFDKLGLNQNKINRLIQKIKINS